MDKKLVKELPETEHMFIIELVGSVTKKRFIGEFTAKIPTLKDQAQIGKFNALLNGEFPVYLDAGIQKLHRMIAYLRYTLIDTPKWWKNSELGYELRDFNIIEAIYDEVIAFENEWLKQVWNDEENDQSENGSTKKD